MGDQGQVETPDVDVVVVGAGFAGLYQLYKLREMGLSARCFETADGVALDPELEPSVEWAELPIPGPGQHVRRLEESRATAPRIDDQPVLVLGTAPGIVGRDDIENFLLGLDREILFT